jgi:hypothetical protein
MTTLKISNELFEWERAKFGKEACLSKLQKCEGSDLSAQLSSEQQPNITVTLSSISGFSQ